MECYVCFLLLAMERASLLDVVLGMTPALLQEIIFRVLTIKQQMRNHSVFR